MSHAGYASVEWLAQRELMLPLSKIGVGEAVQAQPNLNRFLCLSTVINIRGESYRMKEKRKA
jgi:hypothetical protein